jgi:cation transport ATPase
MRSSCVNRVGIVPVIKIVLTAVFCFVLLAPAVLAAVQQAPPGQSEYVPVKDLPPTDQMPAAPLLVAAYAFAWIAAMFYLWTIWRRLSKVEAEMRVLAEKTAGR